MLQVSLVPFCLWWAFDKTLEPARRESSDGDSNERIRAVYAMSIQALFAIMYACNVQSLVMVRTPPPLILPSLLLLLLLLLLSLDVII